MDVLLNNAGGMVTERKVTPQGLEETFAGNYLGPFLLTQLLLDTLIKSAPSRIINVSSASHWYGKVYFDDLQMEKDYEYGKPYYQAKFVNFVGTTPEKAAKRMVYLAASPDVENISGKYWGNCKEAKSSKASKDPVQIERMWKATEAILQNLGYTLWSNDNK